MTHRHHARPGCFWKDDHRHHPQAQGDQASSDTCTIIRRGQYVDEVRVADVNEEQLADMMVGHQVNLKVEKTPAQPGEAFCEIRDLHVKDERGIETVKGLNLTVRKGEIVGLPASTATARRSSSRLSPASPRPRAARCSSMARKSRTPPRAT